MVILSVIIAHISQESVDSKVISQGNWSERRLISWRVTPQLFASLFISNEQCWNVPDLSLAESETGTLRISRLRFAALAQLSRRHTTSRFDGSWEGETISRSSLHLQSAQTDAHSLIWNKLSVRLQHSSFSAMSPPDLQVQRTFVHSAHQSKTNDDISLSHQSHLRSNAILGDVKRID